MKETGKYVDLYTQDKTKPLFAFGFGLTYEDVVSSIDTIEKIGNNKYNIKVKVQNHSDRKLKHSILIYTKIKYSSIKPF